MSFSILSLKKTDEFKNDSKKTDKFKNDFPELKKKIKKVLFSILSFIDLLIKLYLRVLVFSVIFILIASYFGLIKWENM